MSDEIPELPKRETQRTTMDEASAVLSKMKKALREAGLYPGPFTEAGVEWSEEHQAYTATIRRIVKPSNETGPSSDG